MSLIQSRKNLMFVISFFSLIHLQPSLAIESEDVSVLFNRDITTFNSEDELLNYFEKMHKFNQADKTYADEKEQERKRLSLQIPDGLSAEEIGDIPALSTGPDPGITSFDIGFKQYNDYFLALSYDVLYSIQPNRDSIDAPEVISEITLPEYKARFDYKPLIIEDDLLIVVREISYLNYRELLFYNINSDGKIEFDQRYTIDSSNFGRILEMKIVDDSLVFITSSNFYFDSLSNNNFFSSLTATHYVDGSDQTEEVNIASNTRWINTGTDVRDWGREYQFYVSGTERFKSTNIINCPLSSLKKNSLECDITSLFGVDSRLKSRFDINENSVYIWTNAAPKLDYENLSIDNYNDLIRSDEGHSLFNKVFNGDYHKTIYRIDLKNGQVGATLVDGEPISYGSLKGKSGVFSSKGSDAETAINGVRFESYNFSDKPKKLTLDSHQTLFKSEKIKYVGAVENQFIMAKASEEKTNFFFWDSETREVNQLDSDFNVIDSYIVANNLLMIGQDENTHLMIETWSTDDVSEKIDQVKFEKYLHVYTYDNDFYNQQLEDNSFFIIDVLLDNGNRKSKKENTSQSVEGILLFIKAADGSLSSAGGFIALNEDNCAERALCFLYETIYRTLVLDDHIYTLFRGEIHKRKYSSEKMTLLNRLNLSTGESITE